MGDSDMTDEQMAEMRACRERAERRSILVHLIRGPFSGRCIEVSEEMAFTIRLALPRNKRIRFGADVPLEFTSNRRGVDYVEYEVLGRTRRSSFGQYDAIAEYLP